MGLSWGRKRISIYIKIKQNESSFLTTDNSASRGDRFLAALIDGLILSIPWIIYFFMFLDLAEIFKTGSYEGKIGDLAMILRVILLQSKKTPDLYSSMKVLGIKEIKNRVIKFFEELDESKVF